MAQRLELMWIGKEEREKIEPRILIENTELSFQKESSSLFEDSYYDNVLIHGDNLLALKAIESMYAGKIRCIYIDPPYNTGAAFEHYDDNLEHSTWLSLMRERLVMLKKLLTQDGTIFVQIDDNEQAYLKVLMDEIFGRSNFINMVSVAAKVSAGASGGGEDKRLKKNIEYILIYAKDMDSFKPFKPIYKKTELMQYIQKMKEDNKSFKYTTVLTKCTNREYFKTIQDGAGDDIVIEKVNDYEIKPINQIAKEENITLQQAYIKYYDQVMTTTNAQTSIRTRVWDATDSENNMYIATYVPKTGKSKGDKKELVFMGKQKVLLIWLKDTAEKEGNKIYKKEKIGTYWDGFSWINVTKEGGVLFPMGKKPETLIQRVLEMATDEGDIVLDSFLGSGTTAATAHKMRRRWVGIEMGEHAYTHCKVRLDKIISGEDSGGITKSVDWNGGGGYKFYELAPTLINEDAFGEPIISKDYKPDMLAAAVALHEGFKYCPNPNVFWKQSQSNENAYLFVTTATVTVPMIKEIESQMADDEFLVIACKSFEKAAVSVSNKIKIKKIPQMLLGKCEFGKDNYELNIVHPPVYEDEEEE
ncbi:MAG: site-specific DNA-methyltransferase [Candidatus Izemoplasmatales bacterium]|nr:site-specific DNA-methyltransferase [Candidatus Izemoplasmatales bacterium]